MHLETKLTIHSFEMIGWADPEDSKINKASKWLKSLKHDVFMFDAETFDK